MLHLQGFCDASRVGKASAAEGMDGRYVWQGLTASGVPYFQTLEGAWYLYHDWSCDGGSSPPGWIIDDAPPRVDRWSGLGGDGNCSFHAFAHSCDTAEPPFVATWHVLCGGVWGMAQPVIVEAAGPADHVAASSPPASGESLMVLVPGLGERDRVYKVRSNLVWLRRQVMRVGIKVDCVIYVYKRLNLSRSEFSPCQLIHREGQFPKAIKRLPQKRWVRHAWVLLFFADHMAPALNVDLCTMIAAMTTYNLDVVSPSYDQSRPPVIVPGFGPHEKHGVMKRHAGEPVGRLTNFVEWNLSLLTPRAFQCLQQIIQLNINQFGWGYDLLFPKACRSRYWFNRTLRIGVLDIMTMDETNHFSYDYGMAGHEMDLLLKAWRLEMKVATSSIRTLSSLPVVDLVSNVCSPSAPVLTNCLSDCYASQGATIDRGSKRRSACHETIHCNLRS